MYQCFNPDCGETGRGVKQLQQKMYRHSRIYEFETALTAGIAHLPHDEEAMQFLNDERGLTLETARKYNIAVSITQRKNHLTGVPEPKKHLLIPIFDNEGNIIAGRQYLLPAYRGEKDPKIKFAWPKSPISLYPVSALEADTIVLAEGEWDALLLNQHGIPAVTTTAGAGAKFEQFASQFTGKVVYVCFDCDKPGRKGAAQAAKALAKQDGTTVYVVNLKLGEGEDVTDFFVEYGKSVRDFRALLQEAEKVEPPPPPVLPMSEIGAQHMNKQYIVQARVLGEAGINKFLWMSHNVMTCEGYDLEVCSECPLQRGPHTLSLSPSDPRVMALMEQTPQKQRQIISALARIPHVTNTRRCSLWRLEKESRQELAVPVFIESTEDDAPESKRELSGYVTTEQAATQIKSGREAQFLMTPVQETREDGRLMFMAEEVVPLQEDLDTFRMSEQLHEQLKVFQGDPFDKIPEISRSINQNVYRIRGREDLITAYDLVYHAVLNIPNPNAPTRTIKGWAELLVIGDPGEGKSQLAMEMQQYYGLGAIQDGATATPGGLTVTTVQMGGKWIFRDGLLPLNDRRLVFIDEFNKVPHEDMGRLNTSRSSGQITASSSAGTYEKDARVRLIWITNPKDGQRIQTGKDAGDFPISLVPQLFPDRGSQDRLDFAVLILQEDDKPEFVEPPEHEEDPVYTAHLCRSLILWAWSRRADQIHFTQDAVREIRSVSDHLRRKFWHANSSIELINPGERTTERLIRLSAAAAARTYSTADGENLFITPEHVQFVREFLEKQYDKMEYAQYIQSVQMRHKARFQPDDPEEDAEDSTTGTVQQVSREQALQVVRQNKLFRDMLDEGKYDISLERNVGNRNALSWLYAQGYVRTDDARHFKFTKSFYQEIEAELGGVVHEF